MSINLVGVTATGGVPLFTRNICLNKLNEASIPFATLAALNGVNLFSRLNGANLMSTSTNDTNISWKVYKGSIVLIIISTTDIQSSFHFITQQTLSKLLDLIFDMLVLRCGLNEIIAQNIERLKRSLKNAFSSIDFILKLMFSGKSLSLLTQKTDFLLTDNSSSFESILESYSQFASSSFACVMVNKRVVAATKQWWTRLSHSKDALLITLLVNSLPTSDLQKTIEIPIFLPENCPNSVTRLIVTLLFKNVILIVLCGEFPPLSTLETQAIKPLKESKALYEQFKKIQQQANARLQIAVDERIIGFVFVRNDLQLVTKYGNIDDKLKEIIKCLEFSGDDQNCKANESYFVFRNFQCFMILQSNQLIVVFQLNVAIDEMRKIAMKTLNKLQKEKKLWP